MYFTTVFTSVLLAAAMMSQVTSSSTPVLLVVFDSINGKLIDTHMPSLRKDGEIGRHAARTGPIRSVNLTKSFPTLHTIATGVLPNEHGVIADTMFDKNGVKMFNTYEQFNYNPTVVTPIWEEAVQNRNITATYMWPGPNINSNNKPNIIEEYKKGEPWGSHITNIKKWFTNDNIEFGMAYFEDTDNTESVDSYMKRAENAIKELYKELDGLDVNIIITSNHGTKKIQKNNVLNIREYVTQSNCNCEFIVSGAVSFLRFNNSNDLENTYIALKENMYYETRFKVYKKDEAFMLGWNLKGFNLLENTLFVATFNGFIFYDEHEYNIFRQSSVDIVREDGFSKTDSDMNAFLLLIGPSFHQNQVFENAYDLDIKDVYILTRKLLGIKKKKVEVLLSTNIIKLLKKYDF